MQNEKIRIQAFLDEMAYTYPKYIQLDNEFIITLADGRCMAFVFDGPQLAKYRPNPKYRPNDLPQGWYKPTFLYFEGVFIDGVEIPHLKEIKTGIKGTLLRLVKEALEDKTK